MRTHRWEEMDVVLIELFDYIPCDRVEYPSILNVGHLLKLVHELCFIYRINATVKDEEASRQRLGGIYDKLRAFLLANQREVH